MGCAAGTGENLGNVRGWGRSPLLDPPNRPEGSSWDIVPIGGAEGLELRAGIRD